MATSIATEGPYPTPVAPANPDNTYAPARLYCPLMALQPPKATPNRVPTTGIFFNVDLVNDLLKVFSTMILTVDRRSFGLAIIFAPDLVMKAMT